MSQAEYFNAIARALAANAALPPCAKLERFAASKNAKQKTPVSIAVTSDLHCDMRANADAMDAYAREEIARHGADPRVRVLVVAGDVGTSLESITKTLSTLRRSVDALCYLPAGNHELWTSNAEKWASSSSSASGTNDSPWYACDSLGKLAKLIDVCTSLDVRCTPTRFGDVVVMPTYGWYSDDFDGTNREYTSLEARFDAGARWPSWIDANNPRNSHAPGIAPFMSSLNAHCLRTFRASSPDFARTVKTLVTYSHFVPRVELYRGTPSLLKVMGSKIIEDDIRAAARAFAPSAHVHVFGHSHLNVDTTVDGVRYVQCALGYPSERWFGINYPKLVYTTH